MITDTLSNHTHYPLGPAWEKAFEFIHTLNPSTPDGEYPLDGEAMYARVMSYHTKPPAEAVFEAHQKYADIQATLVGAEGIAVVDIHGLEITKSYNPANDVAFYAAPENVPTLVDIYPGSFAFLLPQDCHMPQLEVGQSQKIKKVVVKIALTKLNLGC